MPQASGAGGGVQNWTDLYQHRKSITSHLKHLREERMVLEEILRNECTEGIAKEEKGTLA